jgi:hypothetical protein
VLVVVLVSVVEGYHLCPYSGTCKKQPQQQGDTMTRKHYREIAEAIRITRNQCDGEGIGAIAELAEELANIMKRDNANFKRELFLEACGIES